MVRGTVLFCCALFALAGCTEGETGATNGTSQPAPTSPSTSGRKLSNPEKITSVDGLGELPTWDPCSVVNPQALPRFGPGRFAEPDSLEYCLLEARTDKGTVEVEIGRLATPSAGDLTGFQSETKQGGLRALSTGEEDGACGRLLVFDDGVALSVRTNPVGKREDPQLCEVSAVVLDQVVTSVVNGSSSKFDTPDGSLIPLDPCALITPEMLGKVPGLTKASSKPEPTKHTCIFANGSVNSVLAVSFELGGMPDGGTGQLVDGRFTTKEPLDDEGGLSGCAVGGQHKPVNYRSLPNLIERVSVQVFLPAGQGAAACDAVWAVSGLLWKSLPPL